MIDPKLQAELRAKFNPDGSDLRKIQLRMLDMLKYIDKICRENNIIYWLSSGTCLGAVRHGGFIPWDDDVDIELLPEDYKKLTDYLYSKPNDHFVLQDRRTEPFYRSPFAKLRDTQSCEQALSFDKMHNLYKYKGCAIDIFPLYPSGSITLSKIGNYFQHIILLLTPCKNKLVLNLANSIDFFGTKIFFPILQYLSRIKAKTTYRHKIPNPFYKYRDINDIFPLKAANFEGISLPIPNNYDNYLRNLYGDYSSVPSIDMIHTHITTVKFSD